jgi:hypothetical protein
VYPHLCPDWLSASDRAVVVVEGASNLTSARSTTMLAIGLIVGLIGFGLLCRAIFSLAIHALPFFVAVSAGLAVLTSGGDISIALVVGFAAAVLTLGAGRLLFAFGSGVTTRTMIALVFIVPAAIAGYHAALGFASLTALPQFWQDIVSWAGAMLVCTAAWQELSRFGQSISRPVGADR